MRFCLLQITSLPKMLLVSIQTAAGGDLLNFAIILGILNFGFAIMGHILFGHVLSQYSSVRLSIETSLAFSLGEFDYNSLVEASSPLAAAIYFYSFTFIVTRKSPRHFKVNSVAAP